MIEMYFTCRAEEYTAHLRANGTNPILMTMQSATHGTYSLLTQSKSDTVHCRLVCRDVQKPKVSGQRYVLSDGVLGQSPYTSGIELSDPDDQYMYHGHSRVTPTIETLDATTLIWRAR